MFLAKWMGLLWGMHLRIIEVLSTRFRCNSFLRTKLSLEVLLVLSPTVLFPHPLVHSCVSGRVYLTFRYSTRPKVQILPKQRIKGKLPWCYLVFLPCMYYFLQVNLSNANLEGAFTTGNTSFKGSTITGAGM